MTERYMSLGTARLASVRLVIGAQGPWIADCVLEDDAAIVGGTLTIDNRTWQGKVALQSTFGLARGLMLTAGGGGWGKVLGPRSYANDLGVLARTIADDAAREAGETFGTFAPEAVRVGSAYVRSAGPASRALEDVIGSASWWVDSSGITHVGTRTTATADPTAYELLAFDVVHQIATLSVDDPAAIGVGSVISEGLAEPLTVRDIELTVTKEAMRITAWCGSSVRGELAHEAAALVSRLTDRRLFGMWRYRVVAMTGDRVSLQIVSKATGLPDVIDVSMWPGVAGAHALLAPSAEVLVEFIEGDRRQPVITHFAGKDGFGHIPVSLALCGGTRPASGVGDTVSVFLPPTMAVTGTVSGNPFTGVITIVNPAVGIIESGAPKVLVP